MAKRERINRHKLAVIQAWGILLAFALLGFAAGFIAGRVSAPVKTITVTKTVEVPALESKKLPGVTEVAYYDVPLSHRLQKFIYEICSDEKVPVSLIMAVIDHESQFNPESVSVTDDYGLTQINKINHEWLAEEYRAADMLDPYQNVFCGIKVIARYIEKYKDYDKALMAYNMGDYGAKKAWENGVTSTPYSKEIIKLMGEYEQEVKGNAGSSGSQRQKAGSSYASSGLRGAD